MVALTNQDLLFHGLAFMSVVSAVLVVFMRSPIYSALFLALTMSILGVFFFVLLAPFIAVAQITVYAGAVMVLFIMVVMLFDLNKEHEDIFKFTPVMIAKVGSTALLCGFLMGVGWLSLNASQATTPSAQVTAKDLDKGDKPINTAPTNPPPAAASLPVNPDEDLTSAEADNLVDSNAAVAAKQNLTGKTAKPVSSSVVLSQRLFSKYVFAFEAVSLLLLVAIVGSVGLAKSRGGTHHVAH
jgi:NADH-quinone oxidoreductase subunit J